MTLEVEVSRGDVVYLLQWRNLTGVMELVRDAERVTDQQAKQATFDAVEALIRVSLCHAHPCLPDGGQWPVCALLTLERDPVARDAGAAQRGVALAGQHAAVALNDTRRADIAGVARQQYARESQRARALQCERQDE